MKEQIISGLWKFTDKVSVDTLVQVAEEWSKEDLNYMQLYIRKVSKDQFGIGFMYDDRKSEDSKKSYDEYFNKTSDSLKRKFGNDLVGWDISSSTTVIK